jgi:hypothetical protein
MTIIIPHRHISVVRIDEALAARHVHLLLEALVKEPLRIDSNVLGVEGRIPLGSLAPAHCVPQAHKLGVPRLEVGAPHKQGVEHLEHQLKVGRVEVSEGQNEEKAVVCEHIEGVDHLDHDSCECFDVGAVAGRFEDQVITEGAQRQRDFAVGKSVNVPEKEKEMLVLEIFEVMM